MDMVTLLEKEQPKVQTTSYVHLMRAASDLFKTEQLNHLVIRQRGSQ